MSLLSRYRLMEVNLELMSAPVVLGAFGLVFISEWMRASAC